MSTIHIITSGKGAAGKSLFSSVLSTVLKQNGHDIKLVDADPQKQALVNLYGKDVTPITLGYDPDLEEMPMILLTLAEKSDVIADLAADTDVHINRWLDTCNILEASESLGLTVIKWWVGDGDLGSLRELAESFTDMPNMKHVLVKNLARAREGKWAKAIAQCPEIQTAFDNGLESIELPKLYGTLADDYREARITWRTVLDEHNSKSYEKADLISAGIVHKWAQQCQRQIDSVFPVELPKKPEKKASTKTKRTSTKAAKATKEEAVSKATCGELI